MFEALRLACIAVITPGALSKGSSSFVYLRVIAYGLDKASLFFMPHKNNPQLLSF
jgi:hypothetical protein